MPPLDDETSTWTSSEVAGLRNVAWGAAMVMAGLLAVIVANSIWMAYFRLDAVILSRPPICGIFPSCDPWASLVERIRADSIDSIMGLAVVIWLIAFAIRRASRSISAHR